MRNGRNCFVSLVLAALGTTAVTAQAGDSAVQRHRHVWKIVYTRNDEGLSAWTSTRRRATTLTGIPGRDTATSDQLPVWSPDGQYVAFSRAVGRPGIYVLQVGRGRPRRVLRTFSSSFAVSLAWSRDGRRLAVSVDCDYDTGPGKTCRPGRNGTTALYTVWRDGSHLRRLVAYPSDRSPVPHVWGTAWSRDGRRIAYIVTTAHGCCSESLYTVSANGGRPALVARVTGADRTLAAPSWAPNGRFIAYGECMLPRITSSVFCDLVVRRPTGDDRRVLLPGASSSPMLDTGLWASVWAPDSRTLLHPNFRDGLLAIDVRTGHRRVVLRQFVYVMALAHDARTFAYIAQQGPPSVATMNGRIVERGPRVPFFSGEGPPGSAAVWIR